MNTIDIRPTIIHEEQRGQLMLRMLDYSGDVYYVAQGPHGTISLHRNSVGWENGEHHARPCRHGVDVPCRYDGCNFHEHHTCWYHGWRSPTGDAWAKQPRETIYGYLYDRYHNAFGVEVPT